MEMDLVLNGMFLTIPEGTTAPCWRKWFVTTVAAVLHVSMIQAACTHRRPRCTRAFSCNSILEDLFQDVYLMDDTIERIIALSRPDGQFEEIAEAAKAARCEFIKSSARGPIRQKVGEGGFTI